MTENKKLNIALVCDAFYPMVDGVIVAADNYARILSKKHNVTLFAPASSKPYKDDFPYKVVRSKILSLGIGDYNMALPRLDKQFMHELKNGNFDIIHLHGPFTNAKAAISVAKKLDLPIVITLHSQFKQDFKEKTKSAVLTAIMMKYIAASFNACDELWTMNPRLVELSRDYGYKGKVFVIPNGCDISTDGIDQKMAAEFKRTYVNDNEKLLLFVGRIHILKNIEFIINVCEKLKEMGFPFKMVFVGTGQDFDKFKQMTEDKKLNDKIIFTGKITDRNVIRYHYYIADLFVFPSTYDTDGIVKNEAAGFNTPTISLNGIIASSTMKDKFNGYLEDQNVEKFANKIVDIFKDMDTYNKVCKNAKETLYFTWDEIVSRAEKEYYNVIKNHTPKKIKNKKKSTK